eukprot:6129718-Amphidinium_carterae.1
MRFTAMVHMHSGEFRRAELSRPPDFRHGRSVGVCTRRRSSCMLGVADAATLEAYYDRVADLHDLHGPEAWGLIYQADYRCRKEHLQRNHAKDTGYDAARPWNCIFIKAAEDTGFWAKEVTEKAVVALAKTSFPGHAVDGDAPVA